VKIPRAVAVWPKSFLGVLPVLGWLLPVALFGACQGPPPGEEAVAPAGEEAAPPTTPEAAFAQAIEEAHGLEAWRSQPVFAAEIDLTFGGQPALAGTMSFPTDLTASRLDLANGTTLVFDGTSVWVSPEDSPVPQARFHALTWPYFLAVPMKLQDPGTHLELLGERTLEGVPHPAARLTFAPGVGDTPDDWYVLYRQPETDRLRGMAYIVTYGKSAEEAGKEPHAILYDAFVDVDGVAIPTEWTFWNWNEEEGTHGEPVARMILGNPRFIEADLGAFDRIEGAREDRLPTAP